MGCSNDATGSDDFVGAQETETSIAPVINATSSEAVESSIAIDCVQVHSTNMVPPTVTAFRFPLGVQGHVMG
jgi:hypothetical protein